MNDRVIDLSRISDKLISENENLKKKINSIMRKEELEKLQQENIVKVSYHFSKLKILNNLLKMKLNNVTRRAQEFEKLTSTLDNIYSSKLTINNKY